LRVRTHVLCPGQPAREVDVRRAAALSRPVDVRPARKRQPEDTGDLVESLARGVVDRRAERTHRSSDAGDVLDQQQGRMPTGDEQSDTDIGQRAMFELVDGNMRGEMVDAV